MASLATLGAWVGSAAVSELVTRVTSFFGGQYKLQSDVQDKLQRLKELLLEIESVVEAAEGKEIKNRKLMEWFMELKEVAYNADDLLDTFEYRLLEKKVNEDKEVSSFASSSTNAFKRTCTAAAYYTLLLRDEDVNDLNTLLERLERMASRVGNFLTLLCLDGQSKKPGGVAGQRLTSSLPTSEHSFVGRVKEKKNIINILLRTESSGARNIPVLPILGIGGVGKTTLAQVVYNEARVKSHFSLKMWVCVSESFTVTRITREILEQADRGANCSGMTNFNILQENLKQKLSSEKFLLVLDDIWNETEKRLWDTLKAPLCYGKDGSMILLTSRLPEVAKLMGTMDPIKIEGLPEDEYWSFFMEQSFCGANPEEHPRLVDIGKKIASKLKGSPLAAKTMGALLNDNLDFDHWDSISKSEIWELEKDQYGIMAALKLSYLHLPAHLRQCFAYLSIYPKDWEFKRDDVIRMWMAQGMIHLDSRTKRIEDVGKDYFKELISKSFFQPVNHYKDEYTIHDLLHELAESVSKDDCFRIDGDEFKTIPTTIRHLVVLNGEHLGRLKENKVVLEKLRTLIISYSTDDDDLQDVIRQLRKIRLLAVRLYDLKKCPDNLSSLIHLRHLQLYDIEELELPEELTKLYHLQTLDLDESGIFRFEALSKVPGIGKLTCLQELGMFRVQRDPEFQIVQLKDLRELRGYLIIKNLDCVDSKEEAEEAKLCDKMYLEKLYLVWDEEKNMKKLDEVEVGILEGVHPNPNLKKLRINGYRGTLSPSWMVHNHSLTNLVSLTICNCRAWKDLPPIGQLKWLRRLKICGMDAVKEVGTKFHGKDGFPSLESLELKNFPQWEEWTTEEKVILFPRLLSFQIRGCPKLKSVPLLPTTLNELTLRKVGLTILPKLQMASSSLSSSLETLAISRCINLKSVGEWFLQHHNNFRHLAQVNIEWSDNELKRVEHDDEWKPLALNGFSKLIALERLNISHCKIFVPSDTEEDSGLLPPSLKYLYLENCFVADNIMLKCLQGLSSIGSLKIFGLQEITTISFPSFKNIPSLEILQIKECPDITIITGLEQLAQLKSLEIWRCERLSLISSLEGLSSLETLYVFETKITTIIGLEQLTQLKHLFVYL